MPSLHAADLRLDARWVIPVEPAGVLEHHAVLVRDGRIAALVPIAVADAQWTATQTIHLPSHALIPGLVNAHAHSAMSLMRGIADDVPLKPWLEQHVWPREARLVSPEFVHDGTLLACAEMLRGGITTCSDMYFFPEAAARAYDAVGMRAVLGVPILDFPTSWAADAEACLARGLEARDHWRHAPRLSFALAPHAPYTVGDTSFARVLMFARQLDLPVETHLAETREEVETARTQTGASTLARLDALGVTGPSFIGIHCVHLDAADIALMAAHGCHAVHCPTSNMKLASGIAPVAAMVTAGVNVALGTDGAASNNRLDMLAEMRLASLLAKVSTGDAAALPAPLALAMATLHGARALGLEAVTGSLVPGKDADIVAVDFASLAMQPVYDPVSHLVNVADRDCVTDVWIAGARIVAERSLVCLDEHAVRAQTRVWQQRMVSP